MRFGGVLSTPFIEIRTFRLPSRINSIYIDGSIGLFAKLAARVLVKEVLILRVFL